MKWSLLAAFPALLVSCVDAPASAGPDAGFSDANESQDSAIPAMCPDETPWMSQVARQVAPVSGWRAGLRVDAEYAYFFGYTACGLEEPSCPPQSILRRVLLSGGEIEVVRESAEWPVAMALGPSDVYLIVRPDPGSNVRTLLRIPKAGGDAVPIATSVGDVVAADDNFVYYVDGNQALVRDAADGSAALPIFDSAEAGGPMALQLIDGAIYTLMEFPYPTRSVWRVPTDGADAERLMLFDDDRFESLIVVPPNAFITHFGQDSRDTTIFRFSLATADLEAFVDSQEFGFAMEADSEFLYWTQWNPGWLRRAPLNGGCIESRSLSEPDTMAISADGLVFFADGTLQSIAR